MKVLAIGPAGENLVKFAAIGNDKAHFIGRTGLGAVMGSKNSKPFLSGATKRRLKPMKKNTKKFSRRPLPK